ncbi:MAG: peroxide stress protein YaaA [Solirubrobacterales bacterium]|nr:peroxide stress protein YaaA [Solirubrobacterales bacterium]
MKLCSATGARGANRARRLLHLSEGLAGEIAVDAGVLEAPTLPAARRYTGVLYDHLDLATLPAAERRRADDHVVILSGLWGAVRPGDAIPPYRLSMDVTLPRIGKLTAHWRAPLARALPEPALVVDCRSASYQQAWKPPAGSTVLTVRVFSVAPDGSRKVISHMAKATRGDVARALLTRADGAGRDAGTPEDVAQVARAAGLECELVAPAKHGGAWTLDVLLEQPE